MFSMEQGDCVGVLVYIFSQISLVYTSKMYLVLIDNQI